jgi:4-amino-4-deoxy-L-arabinose transferase-like glycosyltransferase
MLESGDFLVPQLAGEPYTAKPPLFNWLLAASAAAHGGFSEWSVRLPSVVCVLLLALIFVLGAKQWLGFHSLVFLGAAILLSPEILSKGRLAEIEPLFTLLVAGSLWTWISMDASGVRGVKRWLPSLVLVALAYLTKREPAVAFFYLAVGPYLVVRGRWRELFEPGHFVGILAAALIVGSWLYVMAAATSWTELWESLQREVLERGLTDQSTADVLAHLVVYPLGVFAAMLPFSALLPLLAAGKIRQMVWTRFGDRFAFCAVAVIANLPVYWFRGDVAVRYFLPMFPLVLVIAAMIFDVLADKYAEASTIVKRYLRVSGWILGSISLFFVVLLLASAALPRFFGNFEVLLPGIIAVCLALAGAAALVLIRQWSVHSLMPAWLAICITLVVLGRAVFFNFVLADRAHRYAEDRNAPRIAAQLRDTVGDGVTVYAQGVHWAIWYYANDVEIKAFDPDLPTPPDSWILVRVEQGSTVALRNPDGARRFRYRNEEYLLGKF